MLLACCGIANDSRAAWHSVLQTTGAAPLAPIIAFVTHFQQNLGINAGTSTAVDTRGANFIAVWVIWSQLFGTSPPALSDSLGNTWTVGTSSKISDGYIQLYYAANATVGASQTFTVTGVGSYATIGLQAFSGVLTVAPFDVQNSHGVFFSTPTTSIQAGSVTPGGSAELIIACLSNYTDVSNSDRSIDQSFIITDQVGFDGNGGFARGYAYLIQTSAAAVNPTWSWPGVVGTANATITAFKHN